ncbi:MAG: heparinase II/III-family protein [Bacteroidales bacterium]|nr:heparinase II/III-family protein [Bacteroidales bacterium]MCF8390612.1 heparinase II/III-family protein [Bacteroidales bacterium]
MKSIFKLLTLSLIFGILSSSCANTSLKEVDMPVLENPITVEYLKQNLQKTHPRLVLNSTIEKQLTEKLISDPVVKNIYAALKLNADEIFNMPLLEHKLEGRRLLGVSREMLRRMDCLGMVYLIEKDQKVLDRINAEVLAVCDFSDWNPSHFLDVAEMSMAVAIALDWTLDKLPASTIESAKTALIEKGIKPSYTEGNTKRIYGHNNWNQVCNGGMIAASIAIAEKDPELAAKTISRSLEGMPFALVQYMPDGVYVEGSTYWDYGTSFSVVTAAIFESAFGTDFGLADYPGFKESAVFRVLATAPSGSYFNFADCGDKRDKNGDITLAWFATKTGNAAFLEKERFLIPADEMGKLSRFAGAGLVWLSQYQEKADEKVPNVWKGDGSNPIVIFKGHENDSLNYYFGGKGGRATTSHGNMDAGSFVFELNGVRWVVDPGNQNYNALEKTGFDLWGFCQDCERWKLLTKNNFGHSTISVNNELFINEGQATLIDFKESEKPEASFDLTALYGENLKSATRKFTKDSPNSILIDDQIEISEKTELICWQLMTTADIELIEGGAVLSQDGKKLRLENLSHPELGISVVSLYPAPLEIDRQIEGLKRLEIRLPVSLIDGNSAEINVRISGK